MRYDPISICVIYGILAPLFNSINDTGVLINYLIKHLTILIKNIQHREVSKHLNFVFGCLSLSLLLWKLIVYALRRKEKKFSHSNH